MSAASIAQLADAVDRLDTDALVYVLRTASKRLAGPDAAAIPADSVAHRQLHEAVCLLLPIHDGLGPPAPKPDPAFPARRDRAS